MPEMYETIHDLCKQNGTNITAMCRELGIARSSLSELNSGRSKSLSADALSRIAEYFGVSTDTLLGKSLTTTPQSELSPLYFRFGKQAQEMGLSEQDLQFVLDFMADHKNRNQSGGD